MIKRSIIVLGLLSTLLSADPIVVFETNQGKIKFDLFEKKAPLTVKNFIGLVNQGYYNGVQFHRVIKNFMIQGGDPTATGRGGKSIYGGPFKDEIDSRNRFDRPGLLAMANAGPNTNRSQFFITVRPTPHLNRKHTIFGEVIEGMDTVKKIENVRTSSMGRPYKKQYIIKAYVEKQ